METDMEQLRELVNQLQAENERLREAAVASAALAATASSQEDSTARRASSNASVANSTGSTDSMASSQSAISSTTERLVYVPRERKCPMFRGRTGIGLVDWLEEVQSCIRARRLPKTEQAFFIYDHLEGEAREEIKYRPRGEREDPDKLCGILQELYGCVDSYISLQERFFSRKQQEGESLQEFSHALLQLMDQVTKSAPQDLPNASILLRDQFIENVMDCNLRRELKQLVRRDSTLTLLAVRAEAIRWEREGMPGGGRSRSFSVPIVLGEQHSLQGSPMVLAQSATTSKSELAELKDMLKKQQEQINQLTHNVSLLRQPPRRFNSRSVICHRCQQPGHIARDCSNHGPLPVSASISGPREQYGPPHVPPQVQEN